MADQATYQNLGIGFRIARFLRRRFPRHRAKLIARQFGVSVPTADRWLAGYAPTTAHIEEMYAEWGADFLEAVFTEAYARKDDRIKQLEAELERLRSGLVDGKAMEQVLGESAHTFTTDRSEGGATHPSSRLGSDRARAAARAKGQIDGFDGEHSGSRATAKQPKYSLRRDNGSSREDEPEFPWRDIEGAKFQAPPFVPRTVELDAHARQSMTPAFESLASEVPGPNLLKRLVTRWI